MAAEGSLAAANWHQAVHLAAEHEVDCIIVAGDVFHGPNPSAEAIHQFLEGCRLARHYSIPVVAIAGNHDRAPLPSAPAILDALDDREAFPGFFGVTRPGIITVPSGLRIACLPSIGRAQLAAGSEASRAELEQRVVDGLRRLLDGLRALGADVLTLHYSIAGSVLGSEADISLIDEPMLAPADLEGPWKWIAAGHIHKYQPVTADGAYAGSIDRMNFGEEGEPKGVCLFDVEPYGAGHLRFLELPARRFVTVDLGLEDGAPDDLRDAIVRVRAGAGESSRAQGLRAVVLDAGARSCRIELEREPRPVASRGEAIAGAPPLEALRLWLHDQTADRKLSASVMAKAEELAALDPTEAPEWNTPEPHVRRGVPVDMSDYPDADPTEAPR